MQIQLTPDQETRLVRLAAQEGRKVDDLAQEIVDRFLDAEARFVAAASKGFNSLDQGEYLSSDEVGERIGRLSAIVPRRGKPTGSLF